MVKVSQQTVGLGSTGENQVANPNPMNLIEKVGSQTGNQTKDQTKSIVQEKSVDTCLAKSPLDFECPIQLDLKLDLEESESTTSNNAENTLIQREVMESDELLIQAFRNGDRSALETLFVRYRELCYRVAYRLLGNESDSLDAIQEGFIKVFNHLHGFEGRSSFKTWLLRIISNVALDLGRQRRRRNNLLLNSEGSENNLREILSEEQAPDQELIYDDLRQFLQQALLDLPESQRETFILHVDGGLSYKQIAESLGISIGTVMSRLFYARQKLKGLLASQLLS